MNAFYLFFNHLECLTVFEMLFQFKLLKDKVSGTSFFFSPNDFLISYIVLCLGVLRFYQICSLFYKVNPLTELNACFTNLGTTADLRREITALQAKQQGHYTLRRLFPRS